MAEIGSPEGAKKKTPKGSIGGQTTFGRVIYVVLWVLSRTLGVAMFGFRARFREKVPRRGGLLVLSTHQSHLDPLLLGLACDRSLSSLARSSLYDFGPFGAVIAALGAIPIDRDAPSVTSMKTVIAALKRGVAVMVFPEGTRTKTGRLAPLKPGFIAIARRSGVPILPVAIVGAWECWPRASLLPRPGRIRLEFGEVLHPADIAALDDAALLAECTRRITALDAAARAARNHGRTILTPRRLAQRAIVAIR
jgi:1-acyl-sn-glycerol-3-phosphate acyltransferase